MLGILGQTLEVNRANVHAIAITFVLTCISHLFMNDIKCLLLCLCLKDMNAIVKRHGSALINP